MKELIEKMARFEIPVKTKVEFETAESALRGIRKRDNKKDILSSVGVVLMAISGGFRKLDYRGSADYIDKAVDAMLGPGDEFK